jgi:hypothetical protein
MAVRATICVSLRGSQTRFPRALGAVTATPTQEGLAVTGSRVIRAFFRPGLPHGLPPQAAADRLHYRASRGSTARRPERSRRFEMANEVPVHRVRHALTD